MSARLLLYRSAMGNKISLKQANLHATNSEDFYVHAAAALIGVVAGLPGGLFIA